MKKLKNTTKLTTKNGEFFVASISKRTYNYKMTDAIETKTVTLIEYIHLPQHIQDLIEVRGNSTFQEFYIDFNSMEELMGAYNNPGLIDEDAESLSFDDWLDFSGCKLEYEMRKAFPEQEFNTKVTSYILIDW